MRFFIVLGIMCFLVGCDVSLDIPCAGDQDEANKVINTIEARYHFRVMSTRDKRAAVYERPHQRYSEILIFGDYDLQEQAAILKIARDVRKEVATKPVWVYFYPKELEETNLIRKEKIE